MGWASRANQTPRDGKVPTRIPEPPRPPADAMAVFTPTRTVLTDNDGTPLKGADGKPIVRYGFQPNAAPGQSLSDTHYFDGVSIRRVR